MAPRVAGEKKRRVGRKCKQAARVLRSCKKGVTKMEMCGKPKTTTSKAKTMSQADFDKKLKAAETADRRRFQNIFDKYTKKKKIDPVEMHKLKKDVFKMRRILEGK